MRTRGLAIVIVCCLATSCGADPETGLDEGRPLPSGPPITHVTFHGDRERTGWNDVETVLTPSAVRGPSFGRLWDSAELDWVGIGGRLYPPHLYASPLYADGVSIISPERGALTTSVIYAATSNGFVYAINAWTTTSPAIPAGAILWRSRLTTPVVNPVVDGGMPLGVLSTPYLDLQASPPRLYVTSQGEGIGWQAFALDATSGAVLPGWPVALDRRTIGPVNRNGPGTDFDEPNVVSQRGALNLSRDGRRLYVTFGGYYDGATGWVVAVDTAAAAVASSFSSDPINPRDEKGNRVASGGVWAAGGPVIDPTGAVFATTGNGPTDRETVDRVWSQSLLGWSDQLDLRGTYTPFNYCAMDAGDADLGGSSPISFDVESSATPRLLAFGSKQGNLYLIDRDRLPGPMDRHVGCSLDPTSDRSLLSPMPQPQFGARAPLNVFGPYTDDPRFENKDYAKSRSTPARFRDRATGAELLFLSGSSKRSTSETSVPPSIARIRVVTPKDQPAYLEIDKLETTVSFLNPGSPVVSANAGTEPVVWVLDENAKRVASLVDPGAPHAMLYAFDGADLTPLWRTPVGELGVGGKYSTPVIAHGVVFVGTDRIQAYGLRTLK